MTNSSAPAPSSVPSSGMIAAAARLAHYMETRDAGDLADVFAGEGVTIIENFAPHVFVGGDAVTSWAAGYGEHARALSELKHAFGEPQDFTSDGERAFFTLPTTWTGLQDGRRFSERGGWAFVLSRRGEAWRVQGYGWAVTEFCWE